jgi:hypothetical protein
LDQNFAFGIRRTALYGNFLVIAEEWTPEKMNTSGDGWHGVNTRS